MRCGHKGTGGVQHPHRARHTEYQSQAKHPTPSLPPVWWSKTTIGYADAATNPRGIPTAPFVEKVEDYIATRADVEPALRKFQEMISKYQFMEVNTQRRALSLSDKIPEIQKTLDTVRFLKVRKTLEVNTARLYNWEVAQKRKEKEAEGSEK
ncbi:hypothetical protein BGX38DRAFT_1147282 [Terfezia claveryi]|nr:hypothetical protein BGX38DRAFT_1147282 [Terfezia claveryi]